MSVQVLPYSSQEFNKIPYLGDSNKEFHLHRGEEFVLSTLRLILFKHNMHDDFGVMLLHQHFELEDDMKLVDLNNQATGWKLDKGDRLMGGQVIPTSWRILKGKGIMPYEWEFKTLSNVVGIDLSQERYQPFLKDFVSAVEAAGLDNCVALTARPEQPGGVEITQGKSNIFFPTGTYQDGGEQITAGWYFNPKPRLAKTQGDPLRWCVVGAGGMHQQTSNKEIDDVNGAAKHEKNANSQYETIEQGCSSSGTDCHRRIESNEAIDGTMIKEVCTLSVVGHSNGRSPSEAVVKEACTLSVVGHSNGRSPTEAEVVKRQCDYHGEPFDAAKIGTEVERRDCIGPSQGTHQRPTEDSSAIDGTVIKEACTLSVVGHSNGRSPTEAMNGTVIQEACTLSVVGHSNGRFPTEAGVTKRQCDIREASHAEPSDPAKINTLPDGTTVEHRVCAGSSVCHANHPGSKNSAKVDTEVEQRTCFILNHN